MVEVVALEPVYRLSWTLSFRGHTLRDSGLWSLMRRQRTRSFAANVSKGRGRSDRRDAARKRLRSAAPRTGGAFHVERRPDSHNPEHEPITIYLAKHILHIDGIAVGAFIRRLGGACQ